MASKTTSATKSTEAKVKWAFEADYLQGCSCDYGCPCEFEAPPSRGFCEGVGAWRITRGNYGRVSLNGLSMAFSVHFPKAMHLGNGTLALVIDNKATAEQREALLTIASGKMGGLPFEIFPALVTKMLDPVTAPFTWSISGKDSKVRVGNRMSLAMEPIKNPVTKTPEEIRVDHGTGFIFKSAEVVSAKACKSAFEGLSFSWPSKAGFVSRIKYSN